MNIEEAIKHIITYAYFEDDIPLQVATAFDMAISALRAQPAKDTNVPTNRWISVQDRLPEKNQAVLGWYKDNPFAGYTYGVVSWNGKGWVFVYAQRYVTNVTHWMSIPQPPKGE